MIFVNCAVVLGNFPWHVILFRRSVVGLNEHIGERVIKYLFAIFTHIVCQITQLDRMLYWSANDQAIFFDAAVGASGLFRLAKCVQCLTFLWSSYRCQKRWSKEGKLCSCLKGSFLTSWEFCKVSASFLTAHLFRDYFFDLSDCSIAAYKKLGVDTCQPSFKITTVAIGFSFAILFGFHLRIERSVVNGNAHISFC